ncbi:NADPH oxidase organizer 1a [Scleropages formosus]|uniref:NADPH oxidase organizer 1a n=1 Tax=Scleropages formosus TaxID=113540 RepID=A0A8C9SPR2_SCLFO|nr:NADPH oxidase organizer 1 [Scleropages formosus]XP_018610207.1 NADPH oxidase organizer 1 [Scleropages formosus]
MNDQRHPINIRIIGVIHKDKKKLFMTSVLWSDKCDIVVYRTFQEFKNLHNQLKRAFSESPFQRSRVIPRFKAKSMLNFQSREPKSMLHLKFLEKYCDKLMKCDPNVTRNNVLVQFFLPRSQDLQPDFAKNCVIIMPSEDTLDPPKPGNVSTITQPFVTETYSCVAPYETKDTKNRPFKVAVKDTVDVLIKDKGGWWLVENEDKHLAWFPAPYLEKQVEEQEEEEEENAQEGSPKEEGVLYRAVKNYTSTQEDEVSVNVGAVVEVRQKSDNGWWLVRYDGKAGYLPAMYLQPYTDPHLRFLNLQREMHTSAQFSRSRSNLLEVQHHTLSQSQRSLQLLPHEPQRGGLEPTDRQKSRSLNTLSGATPPHPPPTIIVMGAEDKEGSSDGSQFSFGDDDTSLNGSFNGSTLSLSHSDMQEQLRCCRTPPPPTTGRRQSDVGPYLGSLAHSRSDPRLFKMPTTPKVPPRPQAQEILSRCTSVTRKAALSGKIKTPSEVGWIQSR